MSAKVDEDRLQAWTALLQAHAALVEAIGGKLEAERGLPLSWHEVLLRLSDAPGGRLRMADLARSVLLSKSGLTRLVDRMERGGLVERDSCSSDRRGTFAVITPAGRRALRSAAPVFVAGLEEHFSRHLDDAESEGLRAALRKVLQANGWAEVEACRMPS